jgi:hypothetical protein
MVTQTLISPAPRAFVKLPVAIIERPGLSMGAKMTFAVMRFHARQRSFCTVGFSTLAKRIHRSENRIRCYIRELEHAGVVRSQRHGQGRVNTYFLSDIEGIRVIPEPQFVQVQEPQKAHVELEEEQLDRRGNSNLREDCPIALVVDEPIPTPATPAPSLPMRPVTPDPAREVLLRYAIDLGREMRDTASVTATTTRLTNTYRRSGLDLDQFQDAMIAARQTTRERLRAVRSRDRDGSARAMAYLLAVIEERAGLREAPGFTTRHDQSRVPISPNQSATRQGATEAFDPGVPMVWPPASRQSSEKGMR